MGICEKPEIVVHETNLLLIGGGMACCGAAYEADRWATPEGLRVTMVDKAATDRSGAVAMGLSAINTYLGDNSPEDYVRYVRNDLMGITREDLTFDLGRVVDDSVYLLKIGDFQSGRKIRKGNPLMVPVRRERKCRPYVTVVLLYVPDAGKS